MPGSVYHACVGGGGRVEVLRKEQLLDKVGCRVFKEEVTFALHPERRVGVQ